MSVSRKAAIGFIFVTLLIDVIGFGIIIPVMPKLIMELKHVSKAEAALWGGYLLASFAVMQFIFSPVLGNLSDQYGRRPILLISLFGFGIDYLFLAFAPTYELLFLGRIIAGIMGASFTTASAYIADISTPEKRAQNFGMIGAAFGLGFIIGPAIGGVLGAYLGPRSPFIAAAILTLFNWLYGFFVLPESLAPQNRRKFDWKRANPIGALKLFFRYPVILGLVGSILLIYIAGHAVQSTWSYYTMERFDWKPDMVGYSLTFVGLMVAIVQGGLIRVINPKLGQERSIYIGLALYAIGFFLFGFANHGWMMFAFLIPYCLGGIAGPSLQGIMAGQVPANEQGELQGALTSLMSLTSIVGPLLMTGVFTYFTETQHDYIPGAPMFLGAILTIISAVLARTSLKKHLVNE
jgi:DHA1 family tetracycline resistance protein-like MFS transporter